MKASSEIGMRAELVRCLRLERKAETLGLKRGPRHASSDNPDPRDVAFSDATRIEHEAILAIARGSGIQNSAGFGRIAVGLEHEPKAFDTDV